VAILCASILFIAASTISVDRLRDKVEPMFALLLVLLATVLLFSSPVNGARRWLPIGPLHLQPSELAKLFTVFYLSHYLAKYQQEMGRSAKRLLPPLLLVGVEVGLILIEPDLGTSLVILLLTVILLFLGGAAFRPLFLLVLSFGILAVAAVVSSDYRMDRIVAFLDPWKHRLTSGHQLIQSLTALGIGGVFGVGAGEGMQKLFFLPEMHTDFIFSVIGEEFGLLGTLLVAVAFVGLLQTGFQIAREQDDPFRRLLASGTTLMMVIPALIHMGVATALLPTKGLSLPFISYGGSSLLANAAAAGLLFNLSRRVR
jgi:cell division protein FtsW